MKNCNDLKINDIIKYITNLNCIEDKFNENYKNLNDYLFAYSIYHIKNRTAYNISNIGEIQFLNKTINFQNRNYSKEFLQKNYYEYMIDIIKSNSLDNRKFW